MTRCHSDIGKAFPHVPKTDWREAACGGTCRGLWREDHQGLIAFLVAHLTLVFVGEKIDGGGKHLTDVACMAERG